MVAAVPSLEGQTFLTDPLTIIAYVFRRYSRTPADTVPILPNLIISLPYQIAKFGKQPDVLCNNIGSDLNTVLKRIFGSDRNVNVTATWEGSNDNTYNVTVSIMFTQMNGDVTQTGTTFPIVNGLITIPQDKINIPGQSLLVAQP